MNTLFGQNIIASISFDEGEIIRNIAELHLDGWYQLDPCYSIGSFYDRNELPHPELKFGQLYT